MERSYYEEYFFFEQDNWWFVSRRRILMGLLRRLLRGRADLAILDAGCGTGINLSYLREFGQVTGVDVSPEAIRFCRERGADSVHLGDLYRLPYRNDLFDLVTALDVLEHLDEEAGAVREMVRVTKPGGLLLFTVPAFPQLWSDHDEVNHHKRRYRADDLRRLVRSHDCEIERFTYMNTFLFPIAYLVRTWHKMKRALLGPAAHPPRTDFVDYHPVINGLLTAVFTAETPLVATMGLPVGLSLLCLARKK